MLFRLTVVSALALAILTLTVLWPYAIQNTAVVMILSDSPPPLETDYLSRFAQMVNRAGKNSPAQKWFAKMLIERRLIEQGISLAPEEARAWYRAIDTTMPNSALVPYFIGITYESQDDRENAYANYQEALAKPNAPVYSGSLYYRLARLLETSEMDVREGLATDPTPLYELAVENGGFVTFDDALKAHYYLAFLYQEHGEPEKAETMFEWVLRQRPTRYTDFMFLGRAAWEARQDANLAESYLQEAIQLYPDRVWAYRHLAVIQEESGRVDAARKTYEEILKLDPNDSWAASRVARP